MKFLVTIEKKLKYLYVGKNNNFVSKELPVMINNEFQFMLNSDDKFFTLLKDPDTEILLGESIHCINTNNTKCCGLY